MFENSTDMELFEIVLRLYEAWPEVVNLSSDKKKTSVVVIILALLFMNSRRPGAYTSYIHPNANTAKCIELTNRNVILIHLKFSVRLCDYNAM